MRIGEIMNSTEYRMDEKKPKFSNFWSQILVFQIEQKNPKISQILQFRKSSNFYYRQTHKILNF